MDLAKEASKRYGEVIYKQFENDMIDGIRNGLIFTKGEKMNSNNTLTLTGSGNHAYPGNILSFSVDWGKTPPYQIEYKTYCKPTKIIYSRDLTIVWFEDGDKQIVRCKDDEFSKTQGVAIAIAQHVYGTKSQFHKQVEKMGKVQIEYEKPDKEYDLADTIEKLKAWMQIAENMKLDGVEKIKWSEILEVVEIMEEEDNA